jgi:hypothetical protein
MSQFTDQLIGPRPYGLRLDTLIKLRWLAVAGQAFTLVAVHWGLGFPSRNLARAGHRRADRAYEHCPARAQAAPATPE